MCKRIPRLTRRNSQRSDVFLTRHEHEFAGVVFYTNTQVFKSSIVLILSRRAFGDYGMKITSHLYYNGFRGKRHLITRTIITVIVTGIFSQQMVSRETESVSNFDKVTNRLGTKFYSDAADLGPRNSCDCYIRVCRPRDFTGLKVRRPGVWCSKRP